MNKKDVLEKYIVDGVVKYEKQGLDDNDITHSLWFDLKGFAPHLFVSKNDKAAYINEPRKLANSRPVTQDELHEKVDEVLAQLPYYKKVASIYEGYLREKVCKACYERDMSDCPDTFEELGMSNLWLEHTAEDKEFSSVVRADDFIAKSSVAPIDVSYNFRRFMPGFISYLMRKEIGVDKLCDIEGFDFIDHLKKQHRTIYNNLHLEDKMLEHREEVLANLEEALSFMNPYEPACLNSFDIWS